MKTKLSNGTLTLDNVYGGVNVLSEFVFQDESTTNALRSEFFLLLKDMLNKGSKFYTDVSDFADYLDPNIAPGTGNNNNPYVPPNNDPPYVPPTNNDPPYVPPENNDPPYVPPTTVTRDQVSNSIVQLIEKIALGDEITLIKVEAVALRNLAH